LELKDDSLLGVMDGRVSKAEVKVKAECKLQFIEHEEYSGALPYRESAADTTLSRDPLLWLFWRTVGTGRGKQAQS